jgi:hypothetical protein
VIVGRSPLPGQRQSSDDHRAGITARPEPGVTADRGRRAGDGPDPGTADRGGERSSSQGRRRTGTGADPVSLATLGAILMARATSSRFWFRYGVSVAGLTAAGLAPVLVSGAVPASATVSSARSRDSQGRDQARRRRRRPGRAGARHHRARPGRGRSRRLGQSADQHERGPGQPHRDGRHRSARRGAGHQERHRVHHQSAPRHGPGHQRRAGKTTKTIRVGADPVRDRR